MSEEIILETQGRVAVIRLNRPDKLNALTFENRQELVELFGKVRADDEIRVLVLTGTGRGFCSGADVGAPIGSPEKGSRRDLLAVAGGSGLALARLEKPTIAAVNGVAAGAGLSLAMACDIRIASEAARFSAAWVKRALVPDGGATYLLPFLVGMSKALELMYTGDIIDAREAERLGLVSKIVPPDQLMNTAMELANRIAKGPPIAQELIKRAAYKALYDRLESHGDFETYAMKISQRTEDNKEGIKAFLEKREPEFKGR